VKLDDRQIAAQIKQAEAQLARNRVSLDQAERDVRRFTELLAKNAGTQLNLDNARTSVAAAKALIASDQAQLENLKVQLSFLTIRTPISGRVGTFSAKAGNIIRSGDNSATGALGTVVQMSPIYVTFSLAQRMLPELRQSITDASGFVEATPQGATRSVRGKIAILDNSIDPATGTIAIRAEFENADEFLWPGQLCNLRIVLRTDQNVVSIPRDATQSGQNGNFVFVVENGAASVKPVKISRTQDGRDIVETGLNGSETVVTDGALSLVNGARVQIRNEPAKRDS
jgi:RND family efflux transporter MFP subunit